MDSTGCQTEEELESLAGVLQQIISQAAEHHIPKRKQSIKSKVWWTENLTLLRTDMAKQRRIFTREDPSARQWKQFTVSRNKYFMAIREAKQQSWTSFLTEVTGKEVFQAYKYTKPRLIEKVPPIKDSEGNLCQNFPDKCKAFIKAMYPKPPEIQMERAESTSIPASYWPALKDNEVKQVILTSSCKKAPDPDGISFAIIQKTYQAIPKAFNWVYSKLIEQGFHPRCWREGIGIILKKPGKPDYSVPKAYKIITLLNCMGKVAEKIMITRLSYLSQTTNLLDSDQTGGRKQRSAVDAVLSLTHDIQTAQNQGQVVSCLLLNVKGAFNHVSLQQLLSVIGKLQLPIQVST